MPTPSLVNSRGMKMPAFNFQPRFADLVESGQKTQTIRKTCRAKVGDKVSLYTGQRTKQCRKLGEGTITDIRALAINQFETMAMFFVDERLIRPRTADEIARRDGFASHQEMAQWFKDTHGLPFDGWLIRWRLGK